jgi:hypothetical protein
LIDLSSFIKLENGRYFLTKILEND